MSGQEKALGRLILTLADSKRVMGIRYSDWLLGAPSLETGIACSSMAQDEWGHARLLYAMLKELGHDPKHVEHDRSDQEYASVDTLDESPGDWVGVVAQSAIVDEALRIRLAGFSEGGFELAQSRVPKMLAEEDLHRDFSQAWVRSLAAASDESRSALSAAVTRVLPRTLAWLLADDQHTATLVSAGVTAGPRELGDRFVAQVAPLLESLGVEMPEPETSDWDEDRARGPGHPTGDALQRARGDLNRGLLVE